MLTLAGAAATAGTSMVLAPGLVSGLAGMEHRRRELLALRLLGIRDLCLSYGLLRAARSPDRTSARTILDMVALSQVGDLAVTTLVAIHGGVSRPAAVVVWLTAPATLVLALALRRN
jgi:hypothetical protein